MRRRVIDGNDGGNGGPKGKEGKNGGKIVVRVPCGTIAYEVTSDDAIEKKTFLVDLDTKNKNFLAVRGGNGNSTEEDL